MIEKRLDWPSIAAEIDRTLSDAECPPLPPWELVLEVLDAEFYQRGLEITEEDVRFATCRLSMAAESYAVSQALEERRPPGSTARDRLSIVATKALDLMEAIVNLDKPSQREFSVLSLMGGERVPNGDSHTASVLEAKLLSRRGERAALALIEPCSDASLRADIPSEIISTKTVLQLFHQLSELAYAADEASRLPLGEQDLPIWPLLRGSNARLDALEEAADEIAQMFGMMLGQVPSLSRYREPPEARNDGPVITPLLAVFRWIEQRTGIPTRSAVTIEKALARAAKDPTSLLRSRGSCPTI
jgi:hypothetical protein